MERSLSDLARSLRGFKDKKEALETELKEINKAIVALEQGELPKLMEDLDEEKFSVPEIGTVFLQNKLYVSVLKDDRDKLHDWCQENGHEALIVPHIHPATLQAFAKEQLEAGKALPDFVKATFIPTAVIRRK
jgi:hypothetical protein